MTLKINDENIELAYSFISSIYFEQIAHKSLDLTNISSKDFVTLFYCIVLASLQKANKPVITMLDFSDIVDDNGGEKCLMEFSDWYIDIMKAKYEVLTDENDKEPKDVTSHITPMPSANISNGLLPDAMFLNPCCKSAFISI